MVVLQVTADRPGSGKTSLIGAILSQQASQGKRVAYYKPFSPTPDGDPDVTFISQGLLAALDSPPVPAPQPIPAPNDLQAIQSAVAELNDAADLVVIEGADLASPTGEPSSLPMEMANSLDSRVLLLFRYHAGLGAAEIVSACEPFAGHLAGVAINGVTKHRQHRVGEDLVSKLREGGIPVLGALPEDRSMLAMTIEQIAEHLGGHWVQDPVNTDAFIERFLIGGNLMDAGTTYFGRYANQAVITRAERPDIQLACLMEDTKCLILTGGSEPTEYIKAEALQRDVPLIMVEQNTLDTTEALGGLLDRADARSTWKVERFSNMIRQHFDMAALEAILS